MATIKIIVDSSKVYPGQKDFYGDGWTHPFNTITEAINTALAIRRGQMKLWEGIAISKDEDIIIAVAPGTYQCSYDDTKAGANKTPPIELLPLLLNIPKLTLQGQTHFIYPDDKGLPTDTKNGIPTDKTFTLHDTIIKAIEPID